MIKIWEKLHERIWENFFSIPIFVSDVPQAPHYNRKTSFRLFGTMSHPKTSLKQ